MKRLYSAFFVLMVAVLMSGCVHMHCSTKSVALSPVPSDIATGLQYQTTNIDWHDRVELFAPVSSKPLPVVIILPISGGASYFVERYFARALKGSGVASIIVKRGKSSDFKSIPEINDWMKRQTIECRQLVDWIETRPEYDAKRIGLLGTSKGAIRGAFLVGVEPRIKAAVLGLVGDDLPYIISHSTEGAWRGGGISRDRMKFVHEHDMTIPELYAELNREITFDPARVAPCVDPHKVLLIVGLCDTVVPTRTGRDMRKKMHYPETAYLFSGHYSALLYLHYIRSQAVRFLKSRLDVP